MADFLAEFEVLLRKYGLGQKKARKQVAEHSWACGVCMRAQDKLGKRFDLA